MSFKADWDASRRTYLLRVLAETGWAANESVLFDAAQAVGFQADTRETIRADLDRLRDAGCLTQRWAGDLLVAELTPRGDDAARGRIEVDGVKKSVWRPASER